MNDSELRERVADEAKNAFETSKDTLYPMPTDAYAATLFDLLKHKVGDRDLDAVGPQILSAFSAYFAKHELGNLLSNVEAFSKFLLRFIAPNEFERRTATAEDEKLAFTSALKGLRLLSNKTNLNSAPESLFDSPRFADHIVRTFQARNRLAHGAPELSERQKAQIFESVCVLLLFAVAEHYDAIRGSLLVARSKEYLRTLECEFGNWQKNFVQCGLHLEDKYNKNEASVRLHDRLAGDSYRAAVENPKQIADVLKAYSRLLLVGPPGAGKSTTLQFLAGTMAQSALREPSKTARIPVYVQLNQCSPENGRTVRVIVNEITSWKVPTEDVFKEAFLLLDGLNELAAHGRARVVEEVSALLHAYPQLPIIITSRSSEYRDVLALPCFQLQPLDDHKIKELLAKQEDEVQVESLIKALQRHSKLWNWARTPLHLKMFAESADDFGSELPESLGELMQKFTRNLMRREHRQGQQTIETTKETLLAALAFEGMKEGQRSFSKNEAIRILKEARDKVGATRVDVPAFLDEVRDNDLLANAMAEEVTFRHELYQEYFAALEVKNREEIEPMLPETLQADPRWERVLILFSSLAADRVRFFSNISGVNPRLTSRALESRLVNEPEVTELVQRTARSQSSPENLLLLAELGDTKGFGSAVIAVPEYTDSYLEVFVEIFNRAERQKSRNEWEEKTEPEWHRLATVMVEALIQSKAADTLTKLAASVWDEGKHLTLVSRCYEGAIDLGDSVAASQFGAHLVSGTNIDADIPRGIALISGAAEAGYPPAMVDLSDLKFGGIHCSKNHPEAEQWLRRAAELGDGPAMRALGERLLDGDELPKNSAEGKDWLVRAAASGNPSAMRTYASRLLEGDGVTKNVIEGERWLRRAVAAGDKFAKWDLGYRLLDGDGFIKDEAEGISILSECSFRGGIPSIQFAWLGVFDNVPIAKDVKVGPRWLIKAADAGLPRAMCILGNRYRTGKGVPRDYKKGAYWLGKAAEAEDPVAMGDYGRMLLDGDHVAKNPKEGERFLRKAAQQQEMAYSMFDIADLAERLITGRTLPQNIDEGVDWLCKALEIGVFPGPEPPLSPPGSTVMNWITALFVGDKLPHRPDIAERVLRKTAQRGWSWPMRELGYRLSRGDGVAPDPEEGAKWLLKAAETADPLSMYLYGRLRLEGDLISKDVQQGALWLERSAKKEFPEAMRELGNLLIEGTGFASNLATGIRWLRDAANKGYAPAKFDLGRRIYFGAAMTKDEGQGLALVKEAAEEGDLDAKAFVAMVTLERDDLNVIDLKTAVRWLSESANDGHAIAALSLATRLFEGERLPADPIKAERWLRKLANKGNAVAMTVLAFRLFDGDGVVQNPEEAEEWMRRAAAAGDEDAKKFLRENF